jgi:SEC-C motif-containing protein
MSQKKASSTELEIANCYCKSGVSFALCCHPLVNGHQSAQTAEILMRSRYTAFCLHNQDYLLQTWHISTRPKTIDFDAKQYWLGLKVVSTHHGKQGDLEGQVEFVARYKIHGQAYRLHEHSEFLRQDERWFYTQGTLVEQ